jgi:inner membrane protein
MDVLSHTLVGAATAMLAARPSETRLAALAGGLAANVPDLDAFIRSSSDPLLYLEYHRYFTHSLLFIPFGALFSAALLWPFLRKRLDPIRLYIYSLLGISLAAVLDACTSYGTHLTWPFAQERSAWNITSVFDPIFTLLLFVPTFVALRKREHSTSSQWSAIALTLGATYLLLGALQHQRALTVLRSYATQHELQPERLLAKPTFGNLVLWRGIVQTHDSIHVAGIRPSLFGAERIYIGETAKLISASNFAALPADSRLSSDLARFAFFSDGLLSYSTQDATRLGDARYAMRPDSLKPMWSVRFEESRPEKHVELVTDREMTKEDRNRFLEMLLGSP